MMRRCPRYSLAWMILGSLGAVLLGCSPQKTVARYSYLITERQEVTPEMSPSVKLEPSPEVKEVIPEHRVVAISDHLVPIWPETSAPPLQQEVAVVIETARSYLGTPYRYGGMSRLGVDCSGLICLSYQSVNKPLPRTSKAMAASGEKVLKEDVKPGDLVFFDSKNGHSINHVGMVVASTGGDVQFIHATSSAGVRIDRLDDPYWNRRFRQAVAP